MGQQEAHNVLRSIFIDTRHRDDPGGYTAGGGNRRRNQSNQQHNEFQNDIRRYWTGNNNNNTNEDSNNTNTGVASHEGGMLFIDDDMNPAYRGGVSNASGAWSSSILSHEARINADNFPSMQQIKTLTESTIPTKEATKVPPLPTNSLQKISKVIKKSNPSSIAKQKAAREEFQQRAALAAIPYNPFTATNTIHTEESEASIEAKINRNK